MEEGRKVKFDPLTNFGTSRVFYELVSGNRSPKEISRALDINSPAVIAQLHRLRKIGVVRLGGKRGKFQEYEIDWDKFLEIFVKRASRRVKTGIHMKEKLVWTRNKYLKMMCQEFLKNLVKDEFLKVITYRFEITISDAFKDFEDGLIRIFPEMKGETDDEEMRKFLTSLEEWYIDALDSFTAPQRALRDAFKNMGLIVE